MGNAAIFNGAFVKLLKDQLKFNNTARIVTGTQDPTVTATDAEAGSIFFKVAAPVGFFQKADAGLTTNWFPLAPYSASGDLAEILDNELQESIYQQLTKDIVGLSGAALKDTGVSTTTLSQALASEQFTAIGQIYQTINLLDSEFLSAGIDLPSVDLTAMWSFSTFPTSAVAYSVSRDGGVSFQAITMSRVGTTDTLQGSLIFAEESSVGYVNFLNNDTPAGDDSIALNATSVQAIGPTFTIAATSVVKRISVSFNKIGSPQGLIYIQIVRAPGGAPSTSLSDVVAQASPILVTNIIGSDAQFDLALSTALVAGTYAIVYSSDAAYKISYVSSIHEVQLVAVFGGGPPYLNTYDGTSWSNLTDATPSRLIVSGKALDLRVRVTATALPSPVPSNLKALGIFYNSANVGIINGIKNVEFQQFQAVANNLSTFTMTKFLPDPDLFKVYHVETGQVYSYGAFSLNGYQVIFPVNTFNNGGVVETAVTLRFEQLQGTSFDNAEKNVALLTANHLGSTDTSIDRSLSGYGIMIRSAAGTLRELALSAVTDQVQILTTARAVVSSLVDSINAQTIGGAKTWNDVQTWKAVGGTVVAGSYDTAGAWTLGPTTGAALIAYVGSSGARFAYDTLSTTFTIKPGDAGGTVDLKYGANSGAAPSLRILNDSSVPVGIVDNAGAWSLGSVGGAEVHNLNGSALTTCTLAGVSYLRLSINGATRRIPTYNDA